MWAAGQFLHPLENPGRDGVAEVPSTQEVAAAPWGSIFSFAGWRCPEHIPLFLGWWLALHMFSLSPFWGKACNPPLVPMENGKFSTGQCHLGNPERRTQVVLLTLQSVWGTSGGGKTIFPWPFPNILVLSRGPTPSPEKRCRHNF